MIRNCQWSKWCLIFQGPGFLESMFYRVQVHGPSLSPGFTSSLKEETTKGFLELIIRKFKKLLELD